MLSIAFPRIWRLLSHSTECLSKEALLNTLSVPDVVLSILCPCLCNRGIKVGLIRFELGFLILKLKA